MKLKSVLLLLGLVLVSCGYPTRPVDKNTVFTDDLLQAPGMDLNSTAPPVFHPIFSAENYESVLQMNDLSYAIVNEFGYTQAQVYPTDKEIGRIRDRIRNTSNDLQTKGWSSIVNIAGRTGKNNITPDITANIATHSKQRLIVVAFHGSRSGDRSPIAHNGQGDWGSNYDSDPVDPKSLGFNEFPDFVRVHRGFANNLVSAKTDLLDELDQIVDQLGSGQRIWIWTTGHSKGGAMASLGVALINRHFAARGPKYSNVRTGSVVFSSARAFQGDRSQKWVHDIIGRKNIFRINVHLDPVPTVPSRGAAGYRSLGILFLDFITNVNLRTRQKYGSAAYGWLNVGESANIHYGSDGRGLGPEFDPNVVMPYRKLPSGFEEGRLHLKNRN